MPVLSNPASARRFFDRLAPAYDRINALLYRPEWLSEVREAIRGTRVLDVGVGTGHTTGHLEGAVGIDLSTEMLRRARYRGALVRADVLRSPFRAATFDTVVLAGSFYYLPDPAEGLRAVAALLRPGGTVVLLSAATRFLAPLVRILSREEFEVVMEGAGLELERYDRKGWAAVLAVGRKG